jgi:hypothetical protein
MTRKALLLGFVGVAFLLSASLSGATTSYSFGGGNAGFFNNFGNGVFTVAQGATAYAVMTGDLPATMPVPTCITITYDVLITNTNATPISVNLYDGVSNSYDFASPMYPYIGVQYTNPALNYTVPAEASSVPGTLPVSLFRLECPTPVTVTGHATGTLTLPAAPLPLVMDNTNTAGGCNTTLGGNSGTCGTGVPSSEIVITNNDPTGGDAALTVNYDTKVTSGPALGYQY